MFLINKKSFSSILVLLVSIPCLLRAQEKEKGYTISGYINGLEEGEKVTMMLSYSKGYHAFSDQFIASDSTYVKNGEFQITGTVPEGPRRYWMVFDKHQDLYRLKVIEIFIDNGEHITVRSDSSIDKIRHNYIQHYVSIQGSFTNYSSMCLHPALFLYSQSIGTLNNLIQKTYDSIGFNGPVFDGLYKATDALNKALYYSFLYRSGDPEVNKNRLGAFLPEHNTSKHASFWMDLYTGLDEQQRQSFYGKWLKEIAILSVGQPFPEFNLNGVDGKLIALKDIEKKSKITLIHFWASNSIDRIKYENELLTMYNKYHQKGLNIVGVFCDNSFLNNDKYTKVDAQQQWKDILQMRKYPWYNVADFKGKDGIVEKIYRECEMDVANNTTNVLIDSNGKIIAWDVRGCELQYYLWKGFGE